MAVPATRARQILRLLARRYAEEETQELKELGTTVGTYTGHGERVLGHLFDRQRKLVADKARKKSARCGRRAGKTTTAAAYLIREALNYPGGLCGYVTVTRAQAKRLIWRELKRLNKHYSLGITFSEVELIATFPNGSQIWVAGADKRDQIEKFRGVAFLLVVLDETASFKAHLEELVTEVIEPTLEDYGGTVLMIGTPSRACAGLFYEATTTSEEWSKHVWTVLDNPLFPRWRGTKQWRKAAARWLEQMQREKGWANDDPVLLREWKARWVRDRGSLVYQWDPEVNGRKLTPEDWESYDWRYILGVDLGHKDATAFVVVAFAQDVPYCYVAYAEKETGLDITDIAQRIKTLRKQYEFINIVVDTGGLGKMIVEEMKARHNLPLNAAEKQNKRAFQEAMNADFRKGAILADPEGCKDLITEWELIQKDKNEEEDDRFENHCADAALYAWREARHYVYVPQEPQPEPGTQEYYDRLEQELIDAAVEDIDGDEVEELFA